MCKEIKVLWIVSFVRYFLVIVGILGFYDFVIFPSRYNTLILLFCYSEKILSHPLMQT